MGRLAGALLALALGAAGTLQADMGAARDAYWRGVRLERSSNYGAALEAYRASLKADRDFYWAWERLGACQFYLGDRAASLEAYENYLNRKPGDVQARQFVGRLRTANKVEASRMKPPVIIPVRTLGVGLCSGYDTFWMGDFNQAVPQGPGISGGSIRGGLHTGLLARMRFSTWTAGLAFRELSASSAANVSTPESNNAHLASFPCQALGLEAAWLFPQWPDLELSLGAGADYLALDRASDTATGLSYSANGVGGRAFGGVEWYYTDSFSLGLSLGYRFANLGPVYGGGGNLKKADGSNLYLDYSGLALEAGISYWL